MSAGNNSQDSVPNYENFSVRYSSRAEQRPAAPAEPSQPSQASKPSKASSLIAAARSYSQRAKEDTSPVPPFQPSARAASPQIALTTTAPPLPTKSPNPMIEISCSCGGHKHPEHATGTAAASMSPPSYRQYGMGAGESTSPLMGMSPTTTGDSRRDPSGARLVQPCPVATKSYVKVYGPESVCSSYTSSAVPRPLQAPTIKPNPLVVIVLGLVAALCCCMWPCGIVGAVFGVLARWRAPQDARRAKKYSRIGLIVAIVGLVAGIVALAVGLALGLVLGLSSKSSASALGGCSSTVAGAHNCIPYQSLYQGNACCCQAPQCSCVVDNTCVPRAVLAVSDCIERCGFSS